MKNIIIAGSPRAGKTTLSKKINAELGHFIISIDSGQYYFDRDCSEKYAEISNGFALFFQRTLGIGCKSNDNIKDNLRKYYNQEAESRDASTKADLKSTLG